MHRLSSASCHQFPGSRHELRGFHFNYLARASRGAVAVGVWWSSLAGPGSLEDASLERILPAGAEDIHLHKALSCGLQAPSQSPEHSPAPGCTPHTYTGPSDLPGKPGPNERAWCAANHSLQSRLQLSIAPAHTRPRQQGKGFP